ncbi:AraC-like DNA-binding protein [Haloactinomyces albus]|uniref:AraC-like DNA-binding protein n=2 Tax=Haloactinomyces albus TaxID=1352928 RepID=A0AAE3ZBY1_9ACTN|nr:AraC family transcriptional regulator [Haloactinomyces albus]MDR7300856.1 AraC-like DNA-binding protein [Haloactinomyces albus]
MSTSPEVISAMDTHDWNEAARAVSGAYFPHELKLLSPADHLDLSMRTADLGSVTVGRIGWGAEVAIDCDYPDAYEVNMPMAGLLESAHKGEKVVSGEGEGTIFSPNIATPITRWSQDCTVVGVKFDRFGLEREMERVLASPVHRKVEVPSHIDPRIAATRSWMHFVRMLSNDLPHMRDLLSSDLMKKQVSSTITTGFILAVTPDLETTPPARPRIVNRVLDQMHDDPARPWTVADMAEVAEVSVRRLQEGFQQYVGMTPVVCLRNIRLAHAHEDLTKANDSTTVAEVAARWGFTHTGRFAAAYRSKYGMSPSESLHS